MGNIHPLQRRKHEPFASPSSSRLTTRPLAPTTVPPSSSLLPKDQPANPVQGKGFGYSFEHMAVHRPDPEVTDRNESKPVVSEEATNSSPFQSASDGEALAEQDQSIPTTRESTLPDPSSASTLQRRPTSASDPNTPKPPPVNRQAGTKRSGWSIERIAITYNPLAPAQRRATDTPTTQKSSPQTEVLQQQPAESAIPEENTTGLPDQLKIGIESLSGLSLDDVHVHYNSSKPAVVDALAYTQGTEIHVGPGQEEHLAHEAWHVVQQKEGRVQPTVQAKGVAVNDDEGLEREADVMGRKAANSQRPTLQDGSLNTNYGKTLQYKGNRGSGSRITNVVQRAQPRHGTDGNDFESYILSYLTWFLTVNPTLGVVAPARGAPSAPIAVIPTWQPALEAARRLDYRYDRQGQHSFLPPVPGGAPVPGMAGGGAVQLQEMNAIRAFLVVITGGHGLGAGVNVAAPPAAISIINWGSLRNGFGTKVEAILLPGRESRGSQPSILRSTAWNDLTSRKKANGNTLYAKGHLLHDELGGPGLDYNLVPLTDDTGGDYGANNANLAHRQAVEGPVLGAYRNMHSIGGNITQINYEVVADYNRPARPESGYARSIANAYIAERNRLRGLAVAAGGTGGVEPVHAQVLPGLPAQVHAFNPAAVVYINDAIEAIRILQPAASINATHAIFVHRDLDFNANLWNLEDLTVPLRLLVQYNWVQNGVPTQIRTRTVDVDLPNSLRAPIA